MTDAELAEAKRLCEAATPGPWRRDCPAWAMPWDIGLFSVDAERPLICSLDVRYGNTDEAPRAVVVHPERVHADAAFIARSRELLPKLVAEIERLKADFDEYRRGATRTDDQG